MLSGHLCRCTATRRSSTRSRTLATRHAEAAREPRAVAARRLRAPPGARGVPRDPLRRAAARVRRGSPAGSGVEPGERVAVVLDNRLETALLYWAAPVGRRGVRPALVAPLRGRARLLRRRLPAPTVVIRDGDAAARRARAPGRARPRRARDLAAALHLGHDRPAEGRAALARADRAGGLGQALQHGYRYGDRTLGVMPLYHTMGIHSLLAMHLVGGCFVPQARWDAGEALRLIEEQRITSLYLAPTLFHDLVSIRAARRARPLVRPSARLRGRRDDVDARRALRRGLPARRVRQPLRLDRDLHVLDRPRPGGEARLRGAAVAQHAAASSSRTARSASTSRATRPSPATGTGPTPTRRRSATAGTTRATPASSTRTATSGSTAGSTT